MMTLNETMVLILMTQKTTTKITPKLIDNKKKKRKKKKKKKKKVCQSARPSIYVNLCKQDLVHQITEAKRETNKALGQIPESIMSKILLEMI